MDEATKKGSVYEVIGMITKADASYSTKIFSRTAKQIFYFLFYYITIRRR